ncbi:S phase cyclin A-associated protein in the endoplasmic reticulum [Sesamum alatum]|uniref:S phase cyclin A-associated protein in the endoplasmic reticulum n=1 Tax=Sesamum alatum TaxID=300844 RepID=A0AAE1YCX4_9LAMI|nr:S phase cyclin A-associated protein in the endoplasmic reticulum [Sesamum alatum]
MESSEGGDDQASGWMQVKKKHRSNSKFSLHGWVEGISGKQSASNTKNRLSLSKKLENNINETRSLNSSKGRAIHDVSDATNSLSISTEDESVDHYLDKCVVSQNSGKPDSSHSAAIDTRDPRDKLVINQENSNKDAILPKIKWGDLDEGTLIHYGKASGGGLKFGGNKNHNLVSAEAGSCGEDFSCDIPLDPKENEFVGAAIREDKVLAKSHSFSLRTTSIEETTKDVNEVSSEDVKDQITCEKIASQGATISDSDVEHGQRKQENEDTDSPSGKNIACVANEEVPMAKSANLLIEYRSDVSVVPLSDATSSMRTSILCSDTVLRENGEAGTSGESVLVASTEELSDQKPKANSDDLLEGRDTDAVDSDPTGESKERFRERLWCFLFENLNRAVDELYLLCELECDIEQMKEASLVLEEAASDFRELKSRVEKFEKLKRSTSHVADGTPLIMQPDHRRPHALSWEVRRMTTSPRRAEILSSSLEAFRKIQQERISKRANSAENLQSDSHSSHLGTRDSLNLEKSAQKGDIVGDSKELKEKGRKQTEVLDMSQGPTKEKRNVDSGKSGSVASRLLQKEGSDIRVYGKSNRELHGSASDAEKLLYKKNKTLAEHTVERNLKSADPPLRRHNPFPEKEREKKFGNSGKSMDAWKEKRNWEDILASPRRVSSRFSYSPGMSRKSAERVRVLHDKLMSPEKKKKSALDLKKEAEEKHARATRIRTQLENERLQKLQRTSEKLNRVNEWQTVRSNKLRESMFARHQRSESRHEAYLAEVVRRAGDESSKVNEVRFITSLNEENKKHILRKKLQDSELRRAEKLQVIKIKQKEDMAREEAVLERKRLIEAEKLQRLAETQRRKEEAQVRREEERKASSAAREAKAMEQMRRKEIRAKARQEEAELLAQKLAERLSESEQRRKFYLEQIRERASMDFRDQSSPLLRRLAGKEGQVQGRSTPYSNGDDNLTNDGGCTASSGILTSEALQHSLKRRIKRIRQRLMSLKHEFPEPSVGLENSSLGYRTAVGTARGKIARWIQDLQKLRQARKDGAANFGLITAEMIKFLEGRDAELLASRQAGLLDFIASALPASHTSKPEACQVTIYLLRLLRVVLAMPTNKCYFLVQNLLPPIIPLLAASLENYIKMAASLNIPGPTSVVSSKTSSGNLESISEILDGFLWTVAAIIGPLSCNEYQLQMQDGLIELVIAYQIIHRLRDLFALYDRPQVEGSPFPSSILLGINLLTVLTSKFRFSSSIDWDLSAVDVMQGTKLGQKKLSGPADLRFTSCEPSVGGRPLLRTTGSLSTDLPDVPEGRPLDETSIIQGTTSPMVIPDNYHDVECIASKIQTVDIMGESLKAPIEDKHQSASVQKDKNNSISNSPEQSDGNGSNLKQPATFLLSAMSETGLVCLPSMLTAVLLQANNRLSAEQSSYVLPSNFEEVATGVLKVLNNLALIDVTFIQKMLARPDLKMEFFHLMSFILSHCTSNWGVASDKIGMLLLESLSLLGYFALFHPENQAVLRWGKSPTILHKVCDLPFVFFSDPELMPVLAGTLVAASYGCEQNKAVIQQELSMDMLLPSLKLCKSSTPAVHSNLVQNGLPAEDSTEQNQMGPERKVQVDVSQKSSRNNSKSTRVLPQRCGVPASNIRPIKARNQRDGKIMKLNEEVHLGPAQSASETSTLMLHCRFPVSFIDKAEQFFTAEIYTSNGELI